MATLTAGGNLLKDNDQVRTDTGDCSSFSAVAQGAFVGTITFQVLYDNGEGWVSAACFTRLRVSVGSTLTAPGGVLIDTIDAVAVRALMHPYTSGSPEVTFAGMPGVTLPIGGGGGGGGGGPVTAIAGAFVDGSDATQGTTADAGIITDVNGTVVGFLRGAIKMWITFLSRLPAALVGGRLDVNLGATGVTQPVSGTFWQATQPVSAASLPLPTGAATDRPTAAAPGAVELSDGVAFYTAAKTGQLPTTLVGSRLDVNLGAQPATLSAGNSTTALLTANSVFTGTGEDVSGYAMLNVQVFADQASAANGFSFQFSPDNTNWDLVNTESLLASTGVGWHFKPRGKFFRIVYTNGAVNQGVFRMQTLYHTQAAQAGAEANRAQNTTGSGLLGISPLMRSVIHGAAPAAGTAGNVIQSLCSPAGLPFMMVGHPNTQTFCIQDPSAQTNQTIIANSAGTKYVVTKVSAKTANANTNDTTVRIGFGATVPAYGNAQILGSSPGIAAGSGFTEGNGSGILGVGADADPISITCSNPGGSLDVQITYYPVTGG
jgi:hypothetical protein